MMQVQTVLEKLAAMPVDEAQKAGLYRFANAEQAIVFASQRESTGLFQGPDGLIWVGLGGVAQILSESGFSFYSDVLSGDWLGEDQGAWDEAAAKLIAQGYTQTPDEFYRAIFEKAGAPTLVLTRPMYSHAWTPRVKSDLESMARQHGSLREGPQDVEAQDLQRRIDNYIGLRSELTQTRSDEANLVYKSPTGVVLFFVQIYRFGGGWSYSGRSMALPESQSGMAAFA